jgi:RimJ/RimL family protein N-acetyltransferase
MSFNPQPVRLEGRHVRLEPLEPRHTADLQEAGRDPQIWKWMLSADWTVPGEAERWLDEARADMAAGRAVAYAVVRAPDGRAVGSTRLFDFRAPHRALEIGYTWLAPEVQRTAVNTECKLLLLTHCFERLGARRVQLKTDARNAKSRAAIARIGAGFEGILRKYQTRFDGYVRDTAMFALTDDDWPEAKARIGAMLAR